MAPAHVRGAVSPVEAALLGRLVRGRRRSRGFSNLLPCLGNRFEQPWSVAPGTGATGPLQESGQSPAERGGERFSGELVGVGGARGPD